MGIPLETIKDPKLRQRIREQIEADCQRILAQIEAGRPVGGLGADRAKPTALQALECDLQKPASGTQGVALCVTCIAFRKRLLDQHDAVAYSFKPLTDAIAFTLSLDDADPRLRWEYHQVRTAGRTGVIVMVEMLYKLP